MDVPRFVPPSHQILVTSLCDLPVSWWTSPGGLSLSCILCIIKLVKQVASVCVCVVCEGCLVGNMSSSQCSSISQQQICSGMSSVDLSVLCIVVFSLLT